MCLSVLRIVFSFGTAVATKKFKKARLRSGPYRHQRELRIRSHYDFCGSNSRQQWKFKKGNQK